MAETMIWMSSGGGGCSWGLTKAAQKMEMSSLDEFKLCTSRYVYVLVPTRRDKR
jgi:hypothetical protein